MGMRLRWRTIAGYTCVLLIIIILYGWSLDIDKNLVELHTCPACYGQSWCSALLGNEGFDGDIKLSSHSQWSFMKYLNLKNVYYASHGENQVVLKKLAHDSELTEINEKFCRASKLPYNCNVSRAMKVIVARAHNNVMNVISQNKELFEESDAVKCQHSRSVKKLYENFIQHDFGPYHIHHFLTILAVNMEPLVMMTYHTEWFPRIIGTCGRIVIEEFVGPTLTQLGKSPWIVRADYARQLLDMAQQLSEGEIRLYLTDVSLDNFAVDANGRVKLIDAENLVLVDSTQSTLDASEHVNDGFGCKDCLSYSYEDLCSHKLSDHNYFAVCKGMLSASSFSQDIPEGLLHTPPEWVTSDYPLLQQLVEECASHPQDPHKYSKPKRRETAQALYSYLTSILRTDTVGKSSK